MTGGRDFLLAPAGLLRAAAWPLQALDGFGDPELGDRVRRGDGGWERAYARALERERACLWAATLDDPHFHRALAVGSPSARARAEAAARRREGPRNRALRRVEHTLFRYLSRAAGRATPHGLWAGVAGIAFGAERRIAPTPARCRFAPDLRPFQALARGLAARPRQRQRACWRLNPTLHAAPAGGWRFLARRTDAVVERRVLDADPELARALRILDATGPMPLAALAAEVARRGGWPVAGRARVRRMLEALADGGALVGGLGLPDGFGTARAALAGVAEQLEGGDRAAWRQTVAIVAERCDRLGERALGMPVGELVAELDAAADDLNGLADALALPRVALPAPVLRCDLELPWRVVLDGARRDAVAAALGEHRDCWLAPLSPATTLRAAARERLCRAIGSGRPLAETAWSPPPPTVLPPRWPSASHAPALGERLRAWQRCLDAAAPECVLEETGDGAPPGRAIGAALVELHGATGLLVRGVSEAPLQAAARHQALPGVCDAVAWVRERLARDAAARGVGRAELRLPFESNPNALAGASLTDAAVAPWAANPDDVDLRGARLAPGAGDDLVLECRGRRPLLVLPRGTANSAAADPLARVLLGAAGYDQPGQGPRPVDRPTAGELSRGGLSARLRLPGGALLRRRRGAVDAGVASLAAASGSARFAAWQALAWEHGWPERLRVALDGGEPLLMHRDSPLAVEALLKGAAAGASLLTVEEADREQALPVPGSGGHVNELEIAFEQVAARGVGG